MKAINTVGIVGAGTMGSALAQKFAQEGFKVILADRAINFVEKGINNIKLMLTNGVEKKVFTQVQVDSYLNNLKGSADLLDLIECDLIIEAIFENFEAKTELFNSLSSIVPSSTIIATNTSSFSVTELSKSITHPERFVGLHFFYHSAKNRLVEIIPGEKTNDETFEAMKRFSVLAGNLLIVRPKIIDASEYLFLFSLNTRINGPAKTECEPSPFLLTPPPSATGSMPPEVIIVIDFSLYSSIHSFSLIEVLLFEIKRNKSPLKQASEINSTCCALALNAVRYVLISALLTNEAGVMDLASCGTHPPAFEGKLSLIYP